MSDDAKEGMSMILKIAAAVAVVGGGLGAIGVNLPQLATKDEVHAVQVQLAGLTADVIQERLDRLQLRWYQNQYEQEKFKTNGQPIPAWLIKEQADIESQQEKLKRQLDKLSK